MLLSDWKELICIPILILPWRNEVLKIVFCDRSSFQPHTRKDRAEVARGCFQRTPNKYRAKIQTRLLTPGKCQISLDLSQQRNKVLGAYLRANLCCAEGVSCNYSRGRELPFSAPHLASEPAAPRCVWHVLHLYFPPADLWSCAGFFGLQPSSLNSAHSSSSLSLLSGASGTISP